MKSGGAHNILSLLKIKSQLAKGELALIQKRQRGHLEKARMHSLEAVRTMENVGEVIGSAELSLRNEFALDQNRLANQALVEAQNIIPAAREAKIKMRTALQQEIAWKDHEQIYMRAANRAEDNRQEEAREQIHIAKRRQTDQRP